MTANDIVRTEPKCPQAVTAFCIILLRDRCGFVLRNVTAAVLWYTYLITENFV